MYFKLRLTPVALALLHTFLNLLNEAVEIQQIILCISLFYLFLSKWTSLEFNQSKRP